MSYLTIINRVDSSAWNQVALTLFLSILFFFTDTGETKMMRNFSPLKFLETFKKVNLSVDIRAWMLWSGNDAYDDIVDSLGEIVDLVNSEDE